MPKNPFEKQFWTHFLRKDGSIACGIKPPVGAVSDPNRLRDHLSACPDCLAILKKEQK